MGGPPFHSTAPNTTNATVNLVSLESRMEDDRGTSQILNAKKQREMYGLSISLAFFFLFVRGHWPVSDRFVS